MLRNIPKILSPELLKVLCEMGHGDEIVIGDGNFPAENFGQKVIRADGHTTPDIMKAILQMMPLDQYVDEPFVLMEIPPTDDFDPVIWKDYKQILEDVGENKDAILHMERFAFYDRCKAAYAIVATGEESIYANMIIKKGVIN
jgi:L-fucose mutarotase